MNLFGVQQQFRITKFEVLRQPSDDKRPIDFAQRTKRSISLHADAHRQSSYAHHVLSNQTA
jgi:hypothetical protein